ncbi:MAG: hypothetical protein GY861_00360 [bacterium]|nr:hypothetical protein [bacterium]
MGSTTKGSSNVAEQISQDCAGQTVDWTDDVITKVDADATDQSYGIVLTSANGTEYKLSVSDAGALTAEAV